LKGKDFQESSSIVFATRAKQTIVRGRYSVYARWKVGRSGRL